jgi:hypothetical protein
MAIYSAEFTIAGVNTADGVLFNLKTTTTDRAKLLEVGFFVEVAPTNAPQFGLKRMSAVGTGTITTATIALHDAADGAASCTLETAWATTRPTVTGGSFTRGQVPATIGNGLVYSFVMSPIIVPVSSGLCGVMRNASGATTGTLGGYVRWEE